MLLCSIAIKSFLRDKQSGTVMTINFLTQKCPFLNLNPTNHRITVKFDIK